MKNIAIVGATGVVGEKLVQIVAQNMPSSKVILFGNTSVGSMVNYLNKPKIVHSCDQLANTELDYAMFMATNEVSAKYIPQLVRRGVTCIDNSSHFRLHKGVPLVVPCINGEEIATNKLIANPNCSTIQVVVAVNALKSLEPTQMCAVTYQSVSGAGKAGLVDLAERNIYGKLECFRHPIYDNLIPCIGDVLQDGFTSEEHKMVDESRKILALPRLKVNAFCARIPVSVGHGVFVNLRLRKKVDLDEIRSLLKKAPNVLLLDDAQNGLYPMPMTLRNTHLVGVGRITKDPTANAVNMFIVADNLLRGAAYNAYEILQRAMENEKLT